MSCRALGTYESYPFAKSTGHRGQKQFGGKDRTGCQGAPVIEVRLYWDTRETPALKEICSSVNSETNLRPNSVVLNRD